MSHANPLVDHKSEGGENVRRIEANSTGPNVVGVPAGLEILCGTATLAQLQAVWLGDGDRGCNWYRRLHHQDLLA